MKRTFISAKSKILFGTLTLATGLLFINEKQAIGSSSEPPVGFTGSPTDGMNCTACHSGTASTPTSGLTTDIPETGYVPGTQYTITIGNNFAVAGQTKYGFEMAAQNASGTQMGTFAAGTGIFINGKYVGHSPAQSATTPSWQIKWTAPTSGKGDVTFYVAVNAADGKAGNAGDQILLSSLTVKESVASSTENLITQDFLAYFSGEKTLNLSFNSATTTLFYLQILDLDGKIVYSQHINAVNGANQSTQSLSSALNAGVYVVKLSDGKQNFQSKIVLQ